MARCDTRKVDHLGQRIRRLDNGIIGTLYLRKRAVEGIPRIVRVTVHFDAA